LNQIVYQQNEAAMRIANPIYNVVFKYLMSDNRIAKLLVSSIIGQDVISLELRPTEFSTTVSGVYQERWTVYRLDFSALISTPQGSRLAIIEIQKAKFAADMMRFRRYLGDQYHNENNSVEVRNASGVLEKQGIPIVSIYFLGHTITAERIPLINVLRGYHDAATGEVLSLRDPFIEALTHDSFIIQIPHLHEKYRTETEQLLSVFDQTNRAEDIHILNVNEDDYPDAYRPLIRRLQQAVEQKEIRDNMIAEDDYINGMRNMERAVAEKDAIIEKNITVLADKESELAEKDSKLAEKDSKLAEKDSKLAEKDSELAEKDSKLAEKDSKLAAKDSELAEKDSKLTEKDRMLRELQEELLRIKGKR
jgi:hypothetical protein